MHLLVNFAIKIKDDSWIWFFLQMKNKNPFLTRFAFKQKRILKSFNFFSYQIKLQLSTIYVHIDETSYVKVKYFGIICCYMNFHENMDIPSQFAQQRTRWQLLICQNFDWVKKPCQLKKAYLDVVWTELSVSANINKTSNL